MNIYSFLATAVNPIAGAAVIGTSSYGSTFMRNLQERYDPATMTDEDMEKLRENSLLYAGAEFAGEYLGGYLFRKAMGLGGKKVAKDVVKEFGEGFIKRTTKSYFKGFGTEFLAEGLTNFGQQGADMLIYDDEKTFRDFYRGFINDGLIGGLLGGGIGGTMGATRGKMDRQSLYNIIAPKEHQSQLLNVNLQIQNAEAEILKAKGKTRQVLQKRLDVLKSKRAALDRKIASVFDNSTQKGLEAYAGRMDEINSQFDTYTDSELSEETRIEAKNKIQELYKKQNEVLGYFVNERFL